MEDKTEDLSDSEKLNLILAEIADMKARIVKVEAFAEERSRDTQPLLGRIQTEIAETRIEMRERFEKAEEQMTLMREDSKYVRRTAKVMPEGLIRARTEWVENREDLENLEARVEKLEAA